MCSTYLEHSLASLQWLRGRLERLFLGLGWAELDVEDDVDPGDGADEPPGHQPGLVASLQGQLRRRQLTDDRSGY